MNFGSYVRRSAWGERMCMCTVPGGRVFFVEAGAVALSST